MVHFLGSCEYLCLLYVFCVADVVEYSILSLGSPRTLY
jgi:hypothetical protein